MTTMIWAPAWSRPRRPQLPGTAPSVAALALALLLAALFIVAPSCRAADALLPEARPDIPAPRADARAETAVAPALAALQASRTGAPRQQQAMLPARGAGPNLSLLPYLDYLLDESGSLDIEEAAAPDRADAYAPLLLEKLPRVEGVMWLRFTLAPLAQGERPATLLLDMGESIPGTPMLYEPERNDLSGAMEWRETSPAQRNVLLLPEAGAEPVTCYIRLDGLPGLWFSPLVRTPADAATNWGSLARTGAILALGVVMLLCLLRGLSENGQWRIWTALYVAVALGQALLGMPDAGSPHAGLGQAAATLAPGIALILLPHVGRHLMRTRERSRGLDIQLLLLSLPGAVLALLPLVPGWAWLDRWLDLWPAATLLFVPTALGAWLMGLGGARRFLLGCLLPPLFVAAGVLGLDFGIPANLLASAPLWGTALSALLIAATGAPADMAPAAALREGTGAKVREGEAPVADEGGIITLEHPLDDPNLRLISGGRAAAAQAPGDAAQAADALDDGAAPGAASAERARAEAREGALRAPLDDLLREGAALEQCALPPAVKQYAAGMLAAARRMADVLSHADAARPGGDAGEAESGAEAATAFDLQRLLREAHGTVAPAAEYAGIGLAWYMPPHLGQLYRGDAQTLGETLGLLLESAVRATRQGAVHLSARRVPESSDPGNILFTVTDTGTGAPPRDRSSLALARAWELAARHGGYVGMEYGPNGTTIAFSLHLEPLEDSPEDRPDDGLPHVIIVADDPQQRRELARMVADLPCRCSEAASEHEALRRHEADPAALLVAQGRYALPAAADMVTKFMERAAEAGLSGCKVLAVTLDDSQWNLLADSGFTHALLEPVDAEALRHTVRDVIRGVRRVRTAPPSAPGEAPEAQADDSPTGGGGPAEAVLSEPEAPGAVAEPDGAPGEEAPPADDAPPGADEAPAHATGPDETAEHDETAAAAAPDMREAPHAEIMDDGQTGGELSGEEWEYLLAAPAEAAAPPASAPETTPESVQEAAQPTGQGEEPGAPEGEIPPTAQPAPAAEGEAAVPYPAAVAQEPEAAPEAGTDTAAVPGAQPLPEAEPLHEAGPAPDAGTGGFFMEYAVAATPVAEEGAVDGAPSVASASPEVAPAPRPQGAPGSASVYVSPALSTPGEWVGEPMPIGTPMPRRETPQAPCVPEAPRVTGKRPDATARQQAAQPARSGYTSPSVPVPGEWVGEPMPIPRKTPPPGEADTPGAAQAQPSPHTAQAPAGDVVPVAATAASVSAAPEGSFMDFIVGATKAQSPAPLRAEAAAPEQPAGRVADFVETSVSLVTSAVSSAFSPAAAETGAPAQEQAAPAAERPAEQAPSATETGGADATILALVERLDEAMAQANGAYAAGRGRAVAQAAARIAEESESFGFRVLARMARCVERAGNAGDMNALRDLLPELGVSVERNRIALTQRR